MKHQTNYRPFDGVDLSNARSENESHEMYRKRLKQNKDIMKLYKSIGIDAFQEMFPNGVAEAANAALQEHAVESETIVQSPSALITGSLHLSSDKVEEVE